ncbi:hypothetical protein IW148_003734 [Coemansia sp. RSA 1199]|nr:hypothetical protein IW148_003734 [Coemansia sp. RSA 1199]
MADNTHDNADYSVINKAKMTLGHAPAGLYLPGIDETTRKEAVRLCARDYLEHHVFFNDRGFHNHLNHHLLSVFSLGAPAKRLQEVFDLNKEILLPSHSPMDVDITTENFTEYFSNERCYPNYVSFFQRELDAAGDNWKTVACDYFFDPRVFPLGMSGIFHPFIQFGYGLEFESKTIVATALAQTCVHSSTFKAMFSEHVFADICTGELDDDNHGQSLMQILDKMRQDPPSINMEFSTVPSSNSSITDAAERLATKYSKLWSVPTTKEGVSAKYHELLSVVALVYGSITRPGYKLLLHFAVMHCVTSAYFLPIYLDCLSIERQVQILKAHCAVVLATFAVHGSPELYITPEISSKDTHCAVSDIQNNVNNQWLDVFSEAIASNDMHVPKVVRALWRGSLLDSFPSKLSSDNDYRLPPPVNWLYLARITVDTIDFSSFRDPQEQTKEGKRFWTFGMVGHDKFWDTYPKE